MEGVDEVLGRRVRITGGRRREGDQNTFPMQRDPPLWKAGVSIATVKRVFVAMSECLAFQASDPIGRREVANGRARPQSGPQLVSYRMDPP